MSAAVMPLEKECTRCHQVKPLGLFGLHSGHSDGRQSWCQACQTDYIREQRRDPRGHHGSYARAQARAYNDALRTLRERHRAEFDGLLRDAMAAEGLGS